MRYSILATVTGMLILASFTATAHAQTLPSDAQDEATRVAAAAAALSAQGQYTSNSSAAELQDQAARAEALDNSSRGLREWYTRKQLNSDYLSAKNPIPSAGLLTRLNEIKRPARLLQSQYSRQQRKLNWPAVLMDPLFAEERTALDEAFAQRGAFDAGTDSQFYRTTVQLCKQMHDKMVNAIDQMSSTDSISARKFLKSLEFEARILPGDLGGLTVKNQ